MAPNETALVFFAEMKEEEEEVVLNSSAVEVAVTEVGDGRLRSLGRCSQVGTGCAVVPRLGAHILRGYWMLYSDSRNSYEGTL